MKSERGLSLILIILLIAAAVVGGYLVNSGKVSINKNTQNSTIQTQTNSPPSTNKIVNWKTYTNTKYGYFISYPDDKGLILKEDKTAIKKLNNLTQLETSSIFYPNSDQIISFVVWSNPQKLSVQDWWDTNFDNLYAGFNPALNKKQIKTSFKRVGQTQTFFADIGGPRSGPYYIAQNDVIIEINSTVSELFNKILSTFKFE